MRTVIALLVVMSAAAVVSAQPQEQQRPGRQGGAPMAPGPMQTGEVQKLLDGYAVIQGQEFLGLSDTQFAQFLPKFRVLQETRRRNEMERLRLIQELNRITNPRATQVGENDTRDRMRALRELEVRAVGDLQKARDGIDQTLDVRQQGRFRVFEEQLEQRKLQLLMQVRQANRANRPLAAPQQ